jgi:hypothetical protein
MTKICPLMNLSKVIDDRQPASAYHPCIENSCEWYDDEYKQCAIKSIVKAIDSSDYSNMIDNILTSLNDINSSIDSTDSTITDMQAALNDISSSVDNINSCVDR